MNKIWIYNNKVIIGDTGKLVVCENFPCCCPLTEENYEEFCPCLKERATEDCCFYANADYPCCGPCLAGLDGSGSGSDGGSDSGSESGSSSLSGSSSVSGSGSSSGSEADSGSDSGSDSGNGSDSSSESGSSSSSSSFSGSGSYSESGSGSFSGDEYFATIVICEDILDGGDYSCTFCSVFPHRVDEDGIEFSLVSGLYPGGEVIDFAGNRWRAIQVGPVFGSRLDAEDWFGQQRTLTEWDALGVELCCGVKCEVKLDIYSCSINDYFPFTQKWEVIGEDCWVDPETGEEFCMPIEEYHGEGQCWSVNGGETNWCMIGNWEEILSGYDWKVAGADCIAEVNASWSSAVATPENWPLFKTESRLSKKGDQSGFSYYNYYGDWYDLHYWRNCRYGKLYAERPLDLPDNSIKGVVLKLTVRFRMFNFSDNTWGVWAYPYQDAEMSLEWGHEITMPTVDNMPAYHDCGSDEYYDVCPQTGWEKRCAECEINYTVLKYI